ncbi:MAG TPA: alpha/beta hydrolase-fold protein [Chitinophagaceae bacterium]|nr:alpha/beta hydrolase-fold protein [Chitinophagaceae bacterium]
MKIIRVWFTFFLLLFFSCKIYSQVSDTIPTHDSIIFFSKQLKENRKINIWLPKQYKNSKASFEVVYMLDGGIKEDFPHLANTISELINQHKIKPIILVGIENTQRRRDLTGFTVNEKDKEIAPVVGGSEAFRAFIKNELFEEINKRYRTKDTKTIIGESLAGLFITETFLSYPAMFSNYIAFDPSLWWNNEYLVKEADNFLNKFTNQPKNFWFAASGVQGIYKPTNELASIFKNKHLSNFNYKYSFEPKEDHSTIFKATKEKALIWMLGSTHK